MHDTGGDKQTRGTDESAARTAAAARGGGGSHGRASQRIVEQLRLSIRQGQLAPGDRLPAERELCDRYGVSRVTIREALRVLEANGLVDIRLGSHGGAFVTAPTAEGATAALEDYLRLSPIAPGEISEVRAMLVIALIPRACERANSADFEQLTSAYHRLEEAERQGDHQSALRGFHMQLARAARNAVAEVFLGPLHGQKDVMATPGSQVSGSQEPHPTSQAAEEMRRRVTEYRQLLDALRNRDTTLATEIAHHHFGRSPATHE